ncbi:MAG: hypothetical protein IJM28_05285 [Lachnospiraceae bacterium]|nr:hypothetical protein [Lachnospiraceae bacterium]
MVLILKLAIIVMAGSLFFKIEGTDFTRYNGETLKVALIIGVATVFAVKLVTLL